MGIDRDQEARGGDRPQAEVHAVGGAHHPAQEEEHPFRPAAPTNVRQKVGRASPRPGSRLLGQASGFPESVTEARQGLPEIPGLCKIRREPVAQGPVATLEAARPNHQAGDVLATVHAMDPPLQGAKDVILRVGKGRGRGPKAMQGVLKLHADGRDIPEGHAGGHEPDNLLVRGLWISVHEAYGVLGEPGRNVAPGVNLKKRPRHCLLTGQSRCERWGGGGRLGGSLRC